MVKLTRGTQQTLSDWSVVIKGGQCVAREAAEPLTRCDLTPCLIETAELSQSHPDSMEWSSNLEGLPLEQRPPSVSLNIVSLLTGLCGTHQRRQRQAGLPYEAGRFDPRPCAPAAQQGPLLLPSPQDRRTQTQVCARLHRWCQSQRSELGHRQERWDPSLLFARRNGSKLWCRSRSGFSGTPADPFWLICSHKGGTACCQSDSGAAYQMRPDSWSVDGWTALLSHWPSLIYQIRQKWMHNPIAIFCIWFHSNQSLIAGLTLVKDLSKQKPELCGQWLPGRQFKSFQTELCINYPWPWWKGVD